LNGEDASGRLSDVPVTLAGMIRVAVARVTTGRTVQGLVARPVRARAKPAAGAAGTGDDPDSLRITATALLRI
jgi:hypothetical protein